MIFLKNISIAAVVAATILLVSVVMGLSFWETSNEKAPSETPSEYLMREHEGKVAVFNEDGTVYRIFEVNVSLLPEYDKILLKEGIEIAGDGELRARIEDYTS